MDPLNPLVCHTNLLIDMLGDVADTKIPGKLTTFREALTLVKEYLPWWMKDSYYSCLLNDLARSLIPMKFQGAWDCFCLADNLRFRINKEWELYFS